MSEQMILDNFFSALIQKVLQNKNIIHTYLTN